eukprot:g43279.t1
MVSSVTIWCEAVALYYSAFNAVDQFNSARHGKTVLVNLNMLKGDNRPGFFKHLLASKLIESGNEPNLADIL